MFINPISSSKSLLRTNVGLSLVELLVVIAVIGFFSALAIPTVTNIVSGSQDAVAKRNAQNIAMVASVAEVMGEQVFKDVNTLEGAVELVVTGASSHFSNASFDAGDLTEDDKRQAMRFLRFEQGILLYSADPQQGGSGSGTAVGSSLAASPIGNF